LGVYFCRGIKKFENVLFFSFGGIIMWKLKNIFLENLTNDTVFNIAFNLGCPIHYPEIEVNKYCFYNDIDINVINSEEFQQEQERCIDTNGKRIDRFKQDIFNWLIENNYLEVDDDN
jgi:hypothetical protein